MCDLPGRLCILGGGRDGAELGACNVPAHADSGLETSL